MSNPKQGIDLIFDRYVNFSEDSSSNSVVNCMDTDLRNAIQNYVTDLVKKHLDSETAMENNFNEQISELREELQKSERDRINLKGEVEALNNIIRLLGRVIK